jgi:predicted MFS family arabinose efflux permease
MSISDVVSAVVGWGAIAFAFMVIAYAVMTFFCEVLPHANRERRRRRAQRE